MKKNAYILTLLIISSCGAMDYTYQKQIGESYFLKAIDLKESMCIAFGTKDLNEGIVPSTVYEVQWNDELILAKQHSRNSEITNYYLIGKTKFGVEKGTKFMDGPISEYDAIKALKTEGIKLPLANQQLFKDLTNQSKNILYGEFLVDSTQLTIKKDWNYLEESEPGLISKILKRQFPNKLEKGHTISFVSDSTLIHNATDTISYYKTQRQTLNTRKSDTVRELNYYEWQSGGIVLENEGRQGEYTYFLKRKNER